VALAFAKELLGRWAEYNQAIASELPGMVREVETRDPAKLFNVGLGATWRSARDAFSA
jgi:hypothetical protein